MNFPGSNFILNKPLDLSAVFVLPHTCTLGVLGMCCAVHSCILSRVVLALLHYRGNCVREQDAGDILDFSCFSVKYSHPNLSCLSSAMYKILYFACTQQNSTVPFVPPAFYCFLLFLTLSCKSFMVIFYLIMFLYMCSPDHL